jgi:ribosome-binding protein aMBF1 (putative translation factor)
MITPAECNAARKPLGWSQRHVASKLLLDQSVIGKIESRKRLPRALDLGNLQRLFESAGVEFTVGAEPTLKARTIAAGDLNASNDE